MKYCLSLVFCLSLTVSAPVLGARAADVPEEYENGGVEYNSRKKLQRGLTNAATGWLEIPYKVFGEVVFGSRSPFEGLAIGLVTGVAKSVERTGVGLFETATFYIPNYEPILKPEYAGLSFGSVTGDLGDPREDLHVRPPTGFE
jgi:putative exosortase-associated protein (TIGR04073 family)